MTPKRMVTHDPLIRRMRADFRLVKGGFESERDDSGAFVLPQSGCRSRSKFAELGGEFKVFNTLTRRPLVWVSAA